MRISFKWKSAFVSLFLISFAICSAYAQQRTVTGTVTSEDLGPLPGVNIVIQGTVQGAVTDVDGLFVGCEILWGLPGGKPVSIELPHSHDFDEVIGFGGTNRNYPRELGGEIEFHMGGETHILTKTCLIFVPKGIEHCPVTFTRIDTPIFMFEAANNATYEKMFGEK